MTGIQSCSSGSQETRGFDAWFDGNFLDPDGGSAHLPDWFRGDMQRAWSAALECGAELNRHSGAVEMEKRAEHRNPGGGHEVTGQDLEKPYEQKADGMIPRPSAGSFDVAQAAPEPGWNATQREIEIRELRIDNARLRDEAFLRSRDPAYASWPSKVSDDLLTVGARAAYELDWGKSNFDKIPKEQQDCWRHGLEASLKAMASSVSSTEGNSRG